MPSRSFRSARKSPIDLRAAAEARETFGRGGEQRFGVGGAVEQRENGENFFGFEARAFDAQLVDDGFGVGQTVKIYPDGRAARSGLRAGRQPQVFDCFGGFGEIFFEARAVGVRLELFQLAFAGGAGEIAAQ